MLWLANAEPGLRARSASCSTTRPWRAATAYPGIIGDAARLLRRPARASAPTSRTWWTMLRAPGAGLARLARRASSRFIRERWGPRCLGDRCSSPARSPGSTCSGGGAARLAALPPAGARRGVAAAAGRLERRRHPQLPRARARARSASAADLRLDAARRAPSPRHATSGSTSSRAATAAPSRDLDQIPDEELDTLARWGFTGLWLIGAVGAQPRLAAHQAAAAATRTRSPRPTRCATTRIADGPGRRGRLRRPCATAPGARGIRLASDMVPNHMGIDSRWVIEHPDWFLQLDHSPYPAYRFDGPDLSRRRPGRHLHRGPLLRPHRRGRRLQAASTAGPARRATSTTATTAPACPGTTPPSSTTCKPEVREAVIQTILARGPALPDHPLRRGHDAGQAPLPAALVPRARAAAAAIPSRAEHGHDRRQTSTRAMPEEFWREVVDRVAAEAPDTLLLAEAFWLHGGLLRPHPGHAPRLQQRLHEHAARRGERQVPPA